MPTLPLSWDKIAEAAQDAAENPGTKAKALRDIIHNLIAAHEEEVERQVEAAVKEAEKQADDRTESAEDDARSYARAEFLDLLDKYGAASWTQCVPVAGMTCKLTLKGGPTNSSARPRLTP